MIRVTTSFLPTVTSRDISKLSDALTAEVWNGAAEEFAKEIRKQTKGLKCEDHPDANQTVIVKAGKNGITVDKTHFCCTKFKEQINITVNNK